MSKTPVARLVIEVEFDDLPDTETLRDGAVADLRSEGTVKKAELYILKETKVDLR